MCRIRHILDFTNLGWTLYVSRRTGTNSVKPGFKPGFSADINFFCIWIIRVLGKTCKNCGGQAGVAPSSVNYSHKAPCAALEETHIWEATN